jgi:type I restriction enzyme S subunit
MTISDRSNLNQKSFEKLKIPVPKVSVQKQVIAILDRLDAICNDLTSGLPAEIAARQKQYEYYRDKLLSFPEKG